MKKILSIIIVCSILMIGVFIANAAGIEIPNPLQYDTITEVIDAIISFVMVVGSMIAIIMIVWSAILYITAGANQEKVTTARKNLMWTLIGLAIILAAKGIILVVKDLFGNITN